MTSVSTARPERGAARSVLIVTYEYPPLGGGGGVIFRDFAEELAKRIDVTVLTSGRAGLPPHERKGALEIVRVPVLLRQAEATASLVSMLSFFPSSLYTGWGLLRDRRYDLVHTSFAVPSGPSGLLLARAFRLPHMVSVHGGDIYDPTKTLSPHRTPLLKQTVRWVLDGSERVVAQSSDTAHRTRTIYGERPVDVVPLAIRPTRVDPPARAALGVGEEEKVLITIGRLVARKGLDQLLRVVSRLKEPHWRLVVLGEGPERPALETAARDLGVADRVRFEGFVSDDAKWRWLAVSDLYVSTTLHEGFGIVFLESMEMGVPVIAYDKGGQTDFIHDGVGALVRVGDEDAFLAVLERHLLEDDLRRKKSESARALAREFYIDRFTDRYQDLYAQCLAQHRSPSP